MISISLSKYYFITLTICLTFLTLSISSQVSVFVNNMQYQNTSTVINNVTIFGDSLLLTGEVGADSSGLSGILVATMDTNGVLGNIRVIRDPNGSDDLLFSGNSPVLINEYNEIILAGVYLSKDDLFIILLDSKLNVIYFNSYQSNFLSMYIDGLIHFLNCYYVIGTVQTLNFDLDIIIQKFDANGNSIWTKTFGMSTRDEGGFSVIQELDGLTVRVVKYYNPTQTIKNDTRYWTQFMHIDTSGTVRWVWEEEVTGFEGYGGAFVKYGNDYIYTTNYLGDEYNAGILQAAQLVRRDSAFNLVWRKVYGDPNNFYNGFGDMIMSRDSHLLVAGQILDDSEDFNWARMMKVCPNGEIVCETRDTGYVFPNGESLSRMEGILELPSGSIFGVGYSNRSLFQYDGLILKVSLDGCVDTICTTTAIDELIQLEENGMLLYPNPAKSEIHIRLSEEVNLPVLLRLYDIHGRVLTSTWINQYSTAVDISGLPEGLYSVVADHKGKIISYVAMVKTE